MTSDLRMLDLPQDTSKEVVWMKHIEKNWIIPEFQGHSDIDEYSTNTGFFTFNEDEKLSLFRELCHLPPKFRTAGTGDIRRNSNSNYSMKYTNKSGFMIKKTDCDLLGVNVFVVQNKFFNMFGDFTNVYKIGTAISYQRYLLGTLELYNPNIGDYATILISPTFFCRLNHAFTRNNIFFNRVVFLNCDELVGVKNCKIMTLFTWIENRFSFFASSILENIYLDSKKDQAFYECIYIKKYLDYYINEKAVDIPFVLEKGVGLTKEKMYDLVSNLSYITENRKKVINDKILNHHQEVCSLCFEEFDKRFSMVMTPCCFNILCVKCCLKINSVHIKCFSCKKSLSYMEESIFLRLNSSEYIKLEELIPDYDCKKKYVILDESAKICIEEQKNITFITDIKKIKNSNISLYDCVVFLSDISSSLKEKICSKTMNRNLKIYEL